jgi:thiopeptide-type bacteriocin biosynthesis protein
MPSEQLWQQANITFIRPPDAEHLARARLAPALADAEHDGLIDSWWFIRKQQWRIRYQATDQAAADKVLRSLTAASARSEEWRLTTSIYEPETRAFGGHQGMQAAHALFHADSHHVLSGSRDPDDRAELPVLLLTAMMRAAGLEWFEQGDVWARVTERRTSADLPAPKPTDAFTAALGRLLSADTRPLRADSGSLHRAAEWFAAFERTGASLKHLNQDGLLTRGLRDLLAHHVIFTWNRHGLTTPVQAALARTAAQIIFGVHDSHSPVRHIATGYLTGDPVRHWAPFDGPASTDSRALLKLAAEALADQCGGQAADWNNVGLEDATID